MALISIGGSGVTITARRSLSALTGGAVVAHAELARRIEDDGCAPESENDHNAAVLSAIVLSITFLEATVNELLANCADGHPPRDLDPAKAEKLARAWRVAETQRMATVAKFELACLALAAEPLRGRNEHAAVELVRRLRNALVHPVPESVVTYTTDPEETLTIQDLEKRLQGKFALSPFGANDIGRPFFPDRVLSADCARWCRRSAVAFTDRFFAQIGLGAGVHYDRVAPLLRL